LGAVTRWKGQAFGPGPQRPAEPFEDLFRSLQDQTQVSGCRYRLIASIFGATRLASSLTSSEGFGQTQFSGIVWSLDGLGPESTYATPRAAYGRPDRFADRPGADPCCKRGWTISKRNEAARPPDSELAHRFSRVTTWADFGTRGWIMMDAPVWSNDSLRRHAGTSRIGSEGCDNRTCRQPMKGNIGKQASVLCRATSPCRAASRKHKTRSRAAITAIEKSKGGRLSEGQMGSGNLVVHGTV